MKTIFIKNISFLSGLIFFIALNACKKQNQFLDAIPNQSLAVPVTLEDCQSLLDDETVFNAYCDPALGYLSTDDYFVFSSDWVLDVAVGRNTYIFAKDIYAGTLDYNDWTQPYLQVYYTNTVLNVLNGLQLPPAQASQLAQTKGMALFYRCYAFYNLLQTYSMPYDSINSNSDPGIPLRLSPDIIQNETRSTVSKCYGQILTDLKTAMGLLPPASLRITQPSQWAANALLARIYLSISQYDSAYLYANACLLQNNVLTDYNTLTPGSFTINDNYLAEDIFHTSLNGYYIGGSRAQVDSNLYLSYGANDLRKSVFFRLRSSNNTLVFRGTYDVFNGNRYSGLATDEIYLVRAECEARQGNTAAAMNDLNSLLLFRYMTGTFVPLTASGPEQALELVLTERRKELVFRGSLRWTDLRRFNKDPNLQITVTHIIDGITYTLPPNDPRYAMPIPDQEVQLTGIPQNPR
jgi:starch-binding outer membrane protein, SusD/RagB family